MSGKAISNDQSSNTGAHSKVGNTIVRRPSKPKTVARNVNDPKPLRRTPGVEEDDEIANLMTSHVDHANDVHCRDKKTPNEASVAGTEQQSITNKLPWHHRKELQDMIKQQQDAASKGVSSNVVLDTSRFIGSDNLSDLSDNTSRDANFEESVLHAVENSHSRIHKRSLSDKAPRDTEVEHMSSIVNMTCNLSLTALEDLVEYLNRTIDTKYRDMDTSFIDPIPNPSVSQSDENCRKERGSSRSNSFGNACPSPQAPTKLHTSPHILSQTSPSSSFIGAIPFGSGTILPPSNITPSKYKNSLSHSSGHDMKKMSFHKDSNLDSPRAPHSSMDEEDEEEISSFARLDGGNKNHGSGDRGHHRGLSTPSPKHRRVTTTPSKSPHNSTTPCRPGIVNPVSLHLGRDSFDGDVIPLCSATKSVSSKHREGYSPPTDELYRQKKDSSGRSSYAPVAMGIKINVQPTMDIPKSRKHTRQSSGTNSSESTVDRLISAAKLSEFHLSPSSAFDDISVNSMSSSSVSYYSSNYQ